MLTLKFAVSNFLLGEVLDLPYQRVVRMLIHPIGKRGFLVYICFRQSKVRNIEC